MAFARGSSDNRVVLVTGASTGIGLALARALCRTQMRVVLTARTESMERFGPAGVEETERVLLRPLDVTDAAAANKLVADIESRWGGVDVLVNNAAVCYRAVMEHLEDQDEVDQFQTNYLGPLHLIRLVLPSMRAKRSGHIINLSSVGGMMAMPTLGGYSASKFALEGASEALWYELRPWNVRLTLIEPGFVHSNSFRHARFTHQSKNSFQSPSDPYHAYYTNLMKFITKMMDRSPTTPRDVARIIMKTMNKKKPPLRQMATWDAVFFSLIRRLLPKDLYHYVLFRCLPGIKTWLRPRAVK